MIKKFHAATTREALCAVRDALGANAIILSNRKVEGGVEIIAVADMDVDALTERAEPVIVASRPVKARSNIAMSRPATTPTPEPSVTPLTEYLAQREAARPPEPAAARPRAAEAGPAASPAPGAGRAEPLDTGAQLPPMVQELAREMRLLRSLVEGQLAGFAWSDLTRRDPVRAELMKLLIGAGFSSALSNQLVGKLPDGYGLERAVKWVRSVLERNLKVSLPGEDLVERGGVYALVGPTGVGKTTTVAKIAARAVLKYGAARVALITTDSYRIGAQDQLRIYGRILGTPVYAVREENDFDLTLADLAGKHLVLIDTVGMSQRDRRVAEQAAFLSGSGRPVRRLLLLAAPAQGLTLEEVVRSYSGEGLEGCILTKIDEALTYGPALDVVIRHQLKVHYITNGQRVPEDLHLANPKYLIDRAFKMLPGDSPYAIAENEIPVLVAAERSAAPVELNQGARGAYA